MNNINEIGDTPKGQYALGRVAGRAAGRKDYRKKGEFSRKDVRNLKWTEGLANAYHDGRIGGFADGFNDAYMKEYGERCGEPYEKWNESKEVNRKLIRLTESDLHKIVKQSVNKILKESSWADGAEMAYAYHWLTLGASEEQQDADAAYHLYDLLSHNEYNVDEAIKYIQKYGYEDSAMEQEAIPRDSHIFGRSSDGKYILTYDTHTGAFDVWESATMKESKTRSKRDAKTIKEAQVTLSPSHEARLRTVVGELAQQIGSILRKLTMYDRGMNNYLADLVQNEKWVDDLYGVYYSMKEFAEATPQVDSTPI